MSSQTAPNLIIGVAVLALLIYRQLRARPVRGNQRLVLVLAAIGLIEVVQYLHRLHSVSVAIVALAGSLVLAAVFGAARAATVRVWTQDGQPWAQGSLVTAALWVLALAAHLGYDYLVGPRRPGRARRGLTAVQPLHSPVRYSLARSAMTRSETPR